MGGLAAATAASQHFAEAWDEVAKVDARLMGTLAHIKTDLGIADINRYADARQRATGIDDEATKSLVNEMLQLRMNGREIATLVPLIQDMAAVRPDLGDPSTIAKQLHRAISGERVDTLRNMGLDVNLIKSINTHMGRTVEIARELRIQYGGMAEAMDTQFIEKNATAWKKLTEEIGNQMAPLNATFNAIGEGVAERLRMMARNFGGNIRLLMGNQPSGEDLVGRKIDELATKNGWTRQQAEESLKHQRETAKNTKHLGDAMTRQFLGGSPLAQSVLGARNINQAIRAAR